MIYMDLSAFATHLFSHSIYEIAHLYASAPLVLTIQWEELFNVLLMPHSFVARTFLALTAIALRAT